MKSSSYLDAKKNLIKSFPLKIDLEADQNLNGQFNMVSAGLLNFMPEIDFEKHEGIFRNILFHKRISKLDEAYYEALNEVKVENLTDETLTLLKTRPTIICTFHTGSYRIINLLLVQHGVSYSLVMGRNVIEEEGANISLLHRNIQAKNSKEGIKMIDAESPSSGLQMIKELKQGKCLLIYIDGNKGADNSAKNENCKPVNFLRQQIYARTGVAFLSHTAQVPILTVLSYRKDLDKIQLKFFDPIYPNLFPDKSTYVENVTQRIFELGASVIEKYPEQWEGWLYLHKFTKIIRPLNITKNTNKELTGRIPYFNKRFYGIIEINDCIYLFSKSTYLFHPINIELSKMLACGFQNEHLEKIGDKHFRELLENGVLLID